MKGTGASEIPVKNRDRYGEANFVSKFFWWYVDLLDSLSLISLNFYNYYVISQQNIKLCILMYCNVDDV